MKLHLPVALRKCLLLLSVVSTTVTSAWGGAMHENIAQQVYADFGQNRGRYKVTGVSTMLQAIRDKDNGIVIADRDPNTEDYRISQEQGMIDYSGVVDYGYSAQCYGAGAAFGNNYLVTVAHNPHFSAAFGGYVVGSDNTIKYSMVATSEKDLGSAADWALYRQNKIFTDVVGAQNYSGVASEQDDLDGNGVVDIKEQLQGQLMYRAGAGDMDYWMSDGSKVDAGSPYTYIIGGISTIRMVAITEEGFIFADWNMNNQDAGVSDKSPLPTTAGGGDSGTPVYVYNANTGKYEYFFSERATNFTTYNVGHGSIDFANESIAAHSKEVDMTTTHTAYLNAVSGGYGTVTVGETEIEHLGVNAGQNTWKDLSAEKDKENWFAYGNSYMNGISGLGSTHNLVFDGGKSADNKIILNATVDTGVGYLEFKNGKFTIESATGGNHTLNSAGYVIHEGAEVHLRLTNDAGYMREWRKNGEGDLYIEGSGDNNILLAVGGSGTTYLNREGGYAAYNVMSASGATVVIKDIGQIERDFTFGLNGGTLDMNGNDMDWYTTNDDIAADGFSINTLTDAAVLTNTAGTTELTYKQSGDSTWLGSIKDTANGAIKMMVDVGADSVWTMNSICTDLSQNADSSFTVTSGTAVLAGTNTEHGPGSVQFSNDVYFSEDDWHYADAKMDVTVNSGATFHLGTHARLLGDVTVNNGTYIMGEGVRHRMEYIEGGTFLEDTYAWAEYYGHHGDTKLNNGTLKVEFHEDTTANINYGGNITGTGTVSVNAGNGSITLSGENTFKGARSVEKGTLIVADAAAAGSEKWLVKDAGIFAAESADGNTALKYIDSASTGVLALSQDQTSQVDMTGHNSLILGALEGTTINYGAAGTKEALQANANGEWRLGGGGGELVVNYALTGDNKLILGNEHTKGIVTLTNTGNNFTGGIDFVSSGVTLNYTDPAAVNKISLNLTYGNRATMAPMIDNVTASSNGILLLNRAEESVDVSKHANLYLGADGDFEYSGDISVADGQAYRFSAAGGTFTIDSELDGNRDIVVDAQGYTGGTVRLTNISPITGSVTVIGSEAGSGVAAGNITLRVEQDGVLDKSTGIYLSSGTTLDIGESTQYINSLELAEGSSLIGDRMSSATDTTYSTIHLTIDSMDDLKGTINVNTVHKYGDSTLELTNSLTTSATDRFKYSELYIEEGNVKLMSDLASVGSLYIKSGKLDMNGKSLYLGTVVAGDGAVIDATGATIYGMSTVGVLEGTATMINGGTDVTVTTNIGAAKDATLVLSGTGNWKLNGSGYNTIDDNGTLRVEDVSNLTFTYGTNSGKTIDPAISPCVQSVRVGGILDLASSVTTIKSAASCDVQVLDFNTIKLNGQNLTLSETTNQAEWRISHLESTGNETLRWEASKAKTSRYTVDVESAAAAYTVTDVNSSRLIINGESSFAGTVQAVRTANGKAYNSYVELAHDKALQNATLDLQGYQGANMALAVNTDKAEIKGLNGNEHTVAYGGASYRVNQDSAPVSTRDSVLSITGDGTYEFKGAVNGLSISMDGAGTQKFTGSNVTVANIYANSGRLEFSPDTVVTDTIYMGMGGTLDMGDSYKLSEGTTMAIVGDKGSFESTLVLNGGVLAFDSKALNDGTARFVGTMQFAEGVNSQAISIMDPNSLVLGKTYNLLTDNWEGKTATLAADTADYLQSSFTADATGLKMTVTMANGFAEWKGSNYEVFADGTTVVFRDSTVNSELQFNEAASAEGLRIVNGETYSFSGSSVTLDGALQIDSGKLVLNNKLTAATYESVDGTLEIADSGVLELTGVLTSAQDRTATVSDIIGDGTLQVRLDKTGSTYANVLDIDSAFTGTTHVLEGNLSLDGSTFGQTLKLANGVNAQISSSTTINGNIELVGTSQIHQNSGNNLTVKGSVTGEGATWERRGGGTLNLDGEVKLATFDINSDRTTNNFNGKTSLGTINLDKNNTTVTFNGATEIGTFTIGQHNNTATFNGSTSVGTLNIGNNTTSTDALNIAFNGDTTADVVNLVYLPTVLTGTGSLTTKTFNFNNASSINLDGLTVVETQANNRSWSGNKTTTFKLTNGAVLDTRLSYYSVDGAMAVGGADADGIMYIDGIQLSPISANASYPSELNVNAGAHLVIAGTDSGTAAGDFVLAYYGMGHNWNGISNSINVDGTLTSNAAMTLVHNNATLNVNKGGTLNLLRGLVLTGDCKTNFMGYTVNATLNVQEGARLNAAGGVQHANLLVSFAADTTLGAIGEAGETVTFSNNMTWGTDGKEGTITIDTAAVSAGEDLQLVRSEGSGVTVDVTGNITLKGNTAIEVVGSGALKHKAAFNSATAIRVQEGATLAVDSTANLTAGAELHKGALALHHATVSGRDVTVTDSATIRATGGTSTLAAATVLTNSATLSYDVADGATLNATGKITGSGRADLVKQGEGELHLNNEGNAVANILVEAGSLDVYGMDVCNLNDLQTLASTSLGFYAGGVGNMATEAQVVVDGTADFGTGTTLYADLTLATGSTLEIAEGHVSMGSSLTLQQGISMGDVLLQRVKNMNLGDQLVLFTGIDSLALGSTVYGEITTQNSVLASTYFSNILSDDYLLTYSGGDMGELAIAMAVPEPTTATLSLLALAALAARRRRR